MALVNINKKISDPFYRYKMPRVITKVEGRGNGIKTVIVNMFDIAKALHVPPAYPTKFLGIELGAQVIIDHVKDRYIVNGSHQSSKIQNTIYEFVDKYCLCPQCENPETELIVSSKDKIKITCTACGYYSHILHSHKLSSYITKNPPSELESRYTSKADHSVVDSSKGENGVVAELFDEEIDKNLKPTGEVKWITDVSEAAAAERLKELPKKIAELTINPDLEKSVEERLKMFRTFVESNISNLTDESFSNIRHESRRLDLESKAIFVVCDVIFVDENIISHILKYKDLLRLLVSASDSETRKKYQKTVIYSIELQTLRFPHILNPKLVSLFLKLYDNDIVEEEAFLSWSQRKSAHYLKDNKMVENFHKCCDKFISWLKEAESESESNEDADIEFTDQAPPSKTGEIIQSRSPPETPASDDIDDLNIDDI